MTDIKRYTLPFDFGGPPMAEAERGEWIKHTDHTAAIEAVKATEPAPVSNVWASEVEALADINSALATIDTARRSAAPTQAEALRRARMVIVKLVFESGNSHRMIDPKSMLQSTDELAKGFERSAALSATATDAIVPSTALEANQQVIETLRAANAKLMTLIRWAHETLYEINPINYDHDEVCKLNDASVEVILGLAPTLGETHGQTAEWWAARAALSDKGDAS